MKLRITSEQYKTILIREQKERSNENTLMGLSKLIDVPLTGENKKDAEAALANPKELEKIKDTLEDKNKLDSIVDDLDEKGMENPSAKLSNDPQRLIDRLNNLLDKKNLRYVGSEASKNLNDI